MHFFFVLAGSIELQTFVPPVLPEILLKSAVNDTAIKGTLHIKDHMLVFE